MNNEMNTKNRDKMELIKSVLKELDIKLYSITEVQKESVELYFVRKSLDMRRHNHIANLHLTVYRDFEKNGKKMRGSSTTLLYVTMTKEEIQKTVEAAYYAASFVCNPYYELPSGSAVDCITIPSGLSNQSLEDTTLSFVEALYSADTAKDVFINSSEFFSNKNTVRIINSQGIDVSYVKYSISGEFVAQCLSPADVETYKSFHYNDLDCEAMKQLAMDTLELTKSRAIASSTPKTGNYDIILSDQQVETMLSYYVDRSDNSFIYPGYSNYKVGTQVQGNDVSGELLNIQLIASEPYSIEGIPMSNRPLITDGVLNTIQGNSRFAYYLGVPAIGNYNSIQVNNGTMSMNEMKQGSYLHIVNFSDFQMDPLSGDFGGEIRLAFLSDGKTVKPVTGGSISGNMANYHDQLIFSKERQVRAEFQGPYALLLKDVSVSGS